MKKFLIIVALGTAIWSSGRAQTCDTLINLQSNLDTATLLAADTGAGAGYLAGNNVYGDLAKAEAFGVPDTGYYLTTALFYFGYVAINPTDSNLPVTVNVWDNTGVSQAGGSAPGVVLNTTFLTLGQIAQSVSTGEGLLVYFAGGTELTDTVYVGIVLPTAAGDTVALLTNSAPPGPDGNGWELGANGVWNSYNNDWQVAAGSSLGNYIVAGICSAPPTGSLSAVFGGAGNASGCSPDTFTFVDNTVPTPDAWSWSFGDGTYSNVQNPTHVFTAGGSYSVTESVSRNDSTLISVYVPVTNTISFLSSPVIVPTILTTGSNDTGSAFIVVTSGSGHYFIDWSDGSVGDTVYNAPAGDTYTVTVTDQNTCQAVDSILIPFATGIVRLSASQQVTVYPNPASNLLNLQWSQMSNAEISIVDLRGNVLSTRIAEGEMITVYDIHSLASGAYILRIMDRTNNQQQSMPFTKL